MKRPWIATLGVSLLSLGVAFADEDATPNAPKDGAKPRRAGGEVIKRLDKDGDGFVSKDEAPPRLQENFAKIDANGDGKLSSQELIDARAKRGEKGKAKPATDAKDADDAKGDADPKPGAKKKGKAGKRPKPDGKGDGKPDLGTLYKTYDVNGDGMLTKEEAPEAAAGIFAVADANGDGKVSMEEVNKLRGTFGGPGQPFGDPKALFGRLDKDGDGKLSKEDVPERLRAHWDTVDADGDGAVSADEFTKMAERMKDRVKDGKKGKPGVPGDHAAVSRRMFNHQDENADGRLTKEEAKGPLKKNFDKLDANKDGKLDVDEVEAGKPDAPKKDA